MVDYTTVRIRKTSLEKINKMKGEDGSVAEVIEKLLETVDGCNIDDVIEVKRDNVAIPLEYTIFDKNDIKASVFEVTFQDLRQSKVGDMFYANPNPSDKKYMNDIAEVLFVDARSALVRVTEIVKNGRNESSVTHLEHIDLF